MPLAVVHAVSLPVLLFPLLVTVMVTLLLTLLLTLLFALGVSFAGVGPGPHLSLLFLTQELLASSLDFSSGWMLLFLLPLGSSWVHPAFIMDSSRIHPESFIFTLEGFLCLLFIYLFIFIDVCP